MANSQSGLAAHGDERGTNYNKHCSCRVKFTIPCTHARAEKKNYLENVFLLKAVAPLYHPDAMKNNNTFLTSITQREAAKQARPTTPSAQTKQTARGTKTSFDGQDPSASLQTKAAKQ